MKTEEVGVFTLEADVVPVYDDLPEPGVDLQRLGQQPRPAVPHPVTADVQHLHTPITREGATEFRESFYKGRLGTVSASEMGTFVCEVDQ